MASDIVTIVTESPMQFPITAGRSEPFLAPFTPEREIELLKVTGKVKNLENA